MAIKRIDFYSKCVLIKARVKCKEVIELIKRELFDKAEENNIKVMYFPLHSVKSSSVQYGDECYIGMNTKELETDAQRNTCFAHELGHCMTGAFYNPNSPLDVIGRAEYRANKWAVKELIDKNKLMRLLKEQYRVDEIAEYFDVTEDLIRLAYDYYFVKQIH